MKNTYMIVIGLCLVYCTAQEVTAASPYTVAASYDAAVLPAVSNWMQDSFAHGYPRSGRDAPPPSVVIPVARPAKNSYLVQHLLDAEVNAPILLRQNDQTRQRNSYVIELFYRLLRWLGLSST